jgi:hypothetical protein
MPIGGEDRQSLFKADGSDEYILYANVLILTYQIGM